MVIGGVHIKLKLGKDEPVATTDTATAGKPPEIPPTPKAENVDNLRKVIKFDPPKTQTPDTQKPEPAKPTLPSTPKEQPTPPKPNPASILQEKPPTADATREELEQRRTILQNLKDFDFQIKKNSEDISKVTEKLDNLSKDLDDLVSLYEIVSEQMNPFVGLSKVTKKRLDALENITADVDTLKNKLGEFETAFDKAGKMQPLIQPTTPTEPKKTPSTTTPAQDPTKPAPTTLPTQPPSPTLHNPETPATAPTTVSSPTQTPYPPTFSQMTTTAGNQTYSDAELDVILAKAFETIMVDQRIDALMSEILQEIK